MDLPMFDRRAVLMGGATGAVAFGIGLGLGLPGTAGSWSRPGAVLDLDLAGGRFAHAGRNYAGKAALLAAIGGTETGGAVSIGPYVAPDAPELLTNGDFASRDLTGWAVTQIAGGPATADASTGEGVLTGNGADSPALRNDFPVQVGRAYLGRGKVKRGVNLSPQVRFSTLPVMGNFNLSQGANNGTTGFVEAVMTMTPWASVTTAYFGMRATSNPANGTAIADDFSCKECTPFAGFVPAAMSGVIEATTPAAASGSKVLWQTDDGADSIGTPIERNHIRLHWAADKHLHLLVTYQAAAGSTTTQADLDLGVVDVSTPFRVAFSAAPGSFIASLDGQPAMAATSGTFPGAAIMRLGRSQTTANNWDGSIARMTIWAEAKLAEEVEQLAAASVAGLIVAWGDSLTASAGSSGPATRYPAVAAEAFAPRRPVSNQGIGGQSSTEIAARQGGLPIALSVSGDLIPAAGAVSVTARSVAGIDGVGPITAQGAQSLPGRLAGVSGTLTRDGSNTYSFTRAVAGSAVASPPGSLFVPSFASLVRPRTHWLWAGRNGAAPGRTTVADTAAMVAFLGHDRYLVGSILIGANDGGSGQAAFEAANATLAATYGPRFVDLMALLMAANDGSSTDLADVAALHVPTSLRSDAIHLNDAGYAIVAAAFKAAHPAMGW